LGLDALCMHDARVPQQMLRRAVAAARKPPAPQMQK